MRQAADNSSRQTIGRALGAAAVVLFFASGMMSPKEADAADGRRFQGSGGAIHDSGGRVHGGGSHPGSRHFRGGFGVIYAPYWWGYVPSYFNYGYYSDTRSPVFGYDPGASYYGNYPDHGYGAHPHARQTWYYCSDPAGYYPYVPQCKTGWQSVPAG